jgi:hypothetical protein
LQVPSGLDAQALAGGREAELFDPALPLPFLLLVPRSTWGHDGASLRRDYTTAVNDAIRRTHTYNSCQEHDSRVSALRRNPAKLNAILDNFRGASPDQLDPALKAIRPPPR